MANGNGIPTTPGAWIDIASRMITQVGFPVVIAGVLLWFLLTRFQDNMNLITARMAGNTDSVAKLIDSERAALGELQGQTSEFKGQTTELKAQTQELKAQTEALGEQSKLMHQIAQDSGQLVVIRQQELELLQKRLGPGAGPP
jgi:hypothetical protein